MGYNSNRLLLVVAVWMVFGAVFFGGHIAEDATGLWDDTGVVEAGHDCTVAPCMYPAEPGVGGILLGAADLSGDSLYTNGFGNNIQKRNANGNYITVLNIGVNNVQPDEFFIYDTWRYDETATGTRESAYIYFGSETGLLSGSSGCSGPGSCDLLASTAELSATFMQGTVWDLITLSSNDYWIVAPEDDTCSSVSANLCLQAGGNFGASVTVEDSIFRGYEFRATDGDGNDKILQLGEANNPDSNVYVEIRHGTGHDRARVSSGSRNADFANPHPFSSEAAFTMPYPCEGNPSTGNIDCTDVNIGPADEAYADYNG